MGENDQSPLTKAELARHWKVSRPYLTKISKPAAEGGKDMPPFTTLAEADAWRAIYAAPRLSRVETPFAGEQSSRENPAESAKNAADSTHTTTPAKNPHAPKAGRPARGATTDAMAHLVPERIDIASMVQRDVDFDVLTVRHAEEVPQVAYGLFKLAAETGHPSAISAATRNWHEATSAAAEIRTRFLDIQEKSRALISLDEVMDIVGTELQAVRTALLKVGERCAIEANPGDPATAQRVIDAAIDLVFSKLAAVEVRAQRELSAPIA